MTDIAFASKESRTKNYRLFFQRPGIPSDFLDSDGSYKAALETVTKPKVVNDSANRCVAQIEKCRYNSIITRIDNQTIKSTIFFKLFKIKQQKGTGETVKLHTKI